MKCLVCGYDFQANECPVCAFPVFVVPGDAPDAGRAMMQPMIDAYKEKILQTAKLWIVTYRHKEEGGYVVFDREEKLLIGTGEELFGKEKWLAQKLARNPEAEEVKLNISVDFLDKEAKHEISMPNILEPALQEIGATIDRSMHIQLLLRNDLGTVSRSKSIPLLY